MSVLHDQLQNGIHEEKCYKEEKKEDQPVYLQQHQWGYCHQKNHVVELILPLFHGSTHEDLVTCLNLHQATFLAKQQN